MMRFAAPSGAAQGPGAVVRTMASLVGRVLDREGIENRKAYLQLFFCQRWQEDFN